MMLKRFCDRCEKQLESGFTRCVVRFRSGPLRHAEERRKERLAKKTPAPTAAATDEQEDE